MPRRLRDPKARSDHLPFDEFERLLLVKSRQGIPQPANFPARWRLHGGPVMDRFLMMRDESRALGFDMDPPDVYRIFGRPAGWVGDVEAGWPE